MARRRKHLHLVASPLSFAPNRSSPPASGSPIFAASHWRSRKAQEENREGSFGWCKKDKKGEPIPSIWGSEQRKSKARFCFSFKTAILFDLKKSHRAHAPERALPPKQEEKEEEEEAVAADGIFSVGDIETIVVVVADDDLFNSSTSSSVCAAARARRRRMHREEAQGAKSVSWWRGDEEGRREKFFVVSLESFDQVK